MGSIDEQSRKMYDEYVAILKATPNVTASERKEEYGKVYSFVSSVEGALKVELILWQKGTNFVMLDIEGTDCGYWNTCEELDLEKHIKLAQAALRGHVKTIRTPILHVKEVCFKVGSSWECTRTDNGKNKFFSYIKTRKKLE